MNGSRSPKPLATAETVRLVECERIIKEGVDVFMEVGEALTEIRDDKLYRETHKTFEAYCRERWDLGRSRAYQLLDQAKVVQAIGDAGGICPPMVDISERAARAVKADLPAVVEDIKARVDSGEKPEIAVSEAIKTKRSAAVKEKADRAEAAADAKRQREAKQAEHDKVRDETRASLPPEIQALEAAKADRQAGAKLEAVLEVLSSDRVEHLEAENEELRNENSDLKAEIAELRTKIAHYDGMIVQFEQGGVEGIIAGRDEEIRVLKTRVESESREKVRNLRSADFWKQKAKDHGYSADVIIDRVTGELRNA